MHLYRRRCLQRMRTSKEYNEKEEDLEEFLKTVRPEENWEVRYSNRGSGGRKGRS